ncbi:MAG: hypoxanthine phosphoribosyltransferase [Pirellulaceae bacterium]
MNNRVQPENIVTLHDETSVKILLSQEQIEEGVARLAGEIRDHYGKDPLTIIGIMTGSIMLLADVIRLLRMPLRVGVIQTSSYRNGTQRGELTINATLMPDIRDRDVLLLDDIFDTGHTLMGVTGKISEFGPKSLRSAVLLSKTGRCEVDMQPDFVTFDIPDEFVIGYGLDYADEYRNLPFIGSIVSLPRPD